MKTVQIVKENLMETKGMTPGDEVALIEDWCDIGTVKAMLIALDEMLKGNFMEIVLIELDGELFGFKVDMLEGEVNGPFRPDGE